MYTSNQQDMPRKTQVVCIQELLGDDVKSLNQADWSGWSREKAEEWHWFMGRFAGNHGFSIVFFTCKCWNFQGFLPFFP